MPAFFRWWRGMDSHTLRVHQGSTFPYNKRKAAQSEKGGKDNSKQATVPFSQLPTLAFISVQYYQWNKLMQAQIRAMTRCQHPFQYISTNTKAPGTKHFKGFTWGTQMQCATRYYTSLTLHHAALKKAQWNSSLFYKCTASWTFHKLRIQ